MGALALRPADLRDFDGEARVQDLRLGEVLGYGDPKKVRQIIRRNRGELFAHGVLAQSEAKPLPGSVGGRPERSFLLNEAQAVLITMFSRTERAAEARRQIVSVFLAYRRGNLTPAPALLPAHDPMEGLVRRMELLEQAVSLHSTRQSEAFPLALAHVPLKKRHRYPAFWSDLPLRAMVVSCHRQMSVREAIERMQAELGRAPSKSALARCWMWLDEVAGRAFHRIH